MQTRSWSGCGRRARQSRRSPRRSCPRPRAKTLGRPVGVRLAARLGSTSPATCARSSAIGEAARLLIAGLRSAGVPYSVVHYGETSNRQDAPFDDAGSGAPTHPVNIVCVNADRLPHFLDHVGPEFTRDRYTIGVWFWEVEEFPEMMRASAELLDEIWVASRHAALAIAPAVTRPVLIAPFPVVPPARPSGRRRTSVCRTSSRSSSRSTSTASSSERTRRASSRRSGVRSVGEGGPILVLKTINGDIQAAAAEELRAATEGRPDIVLIDEYLSAHEHHALTSVCDAYVSLHRAEGLGLTMAEAMALGKPVIATAYSGNLEFMTPHNSYLVPYRYSEVPPGADPYPAGARWAEPDLDAAAEHHASRRQCSRRRAEARRAGRKGHPDVLVARGDGALPAPPAGDAAAGASGSARATERAPGAPAVGVLVDAGRGGDCGGAANLNTPGCPLVPPPRSAAAPKPRRAQPRDDVHARREHRPARTGGGGAGTRRGCCRGTPGHARGARARGRPRVDEISGAANAAQRLRVIACTIVARNYLAQARVLAESYAAHHGGERLRVLVVDAEAGDPLAPREETFELVVPSQLPLDPLEFRVMAAIYDVTELSTAVKPWLLQHLVREGITVYLDPDIEVFAPLDELDPLAGEGEIVLIPHTREPVPDDGRKPTREDLARAGVYNLGFVAVSLGAWDYLRWWGERLRRDCLVAFEEGLFVDQRVLDTVTRLYEHRVLRGPEWNVAYWNLHERNVEWSGDGYEVEGRQLRFFHFSGFDPDRPERLSKHQGDRPRILLDDRPAVARICREYAAKLLAAGHRELTRLPYGFDRAADGTLLDRGIRRTYRDAALAADDGGLAELPDPFNPADADGFRAWLAGAGDAARARTRAALYLRSGNDLPSGRKLARPFHRAVNRALSHHDLHQARIDTALLEALNDLHRDLRGTREEVAAGARAQAWPVDGLGGAVDRITAHLEELERSLRERFAPIELQLNDVAATLARLEAELTSAPSATTPGPLLTTDTSGNPQLGYRGGSTDQRPGYLGFADLFRGDEDAILERQRPYVDLLRGHAPVFDLGCGRGELLDLLAEAGIDAFGADLDAHMATRAREKGHRVEHADGIELLERCDDESLGAIFCAQVIEHLAHEDLIRLFRLARAKLRRDGLLVCETVNPHSPQALKSFWLDPTHAHPLFPETIVALCRAEGFESAVVIFPSRGRWSGISARPAITRSWQRMHHTRSPVGS